MGNGASVVPSLAHVNTDKNTVLTALGPVSVKAASSHLKKCAMA